MHIVDERPRLIEIVRDFVDFYEASLPRPWSIEDVDDQFVDGVRHVLAEVTPWLVNSVSEQDNVNWRQAPVHILVGGSKLDRGFTVEGAEPEVVDREAPNRRLGVRSQVDLDLVAGLVVDGDIRK